MSEKNDTQKDGIASLKELGLKEVSDKTFINLASLTALLDKDFSKINKTKAMGFIQILERNFKVDLSGLKEEYLVHYNSKHTKKTYHRAIPDVSEGKEPKKILRYVLLALLAAIGGYYLFSNVKSDIQVESLDLNVVKNEPITQEAKESLLVLEPNDTLEVEEVEDVDLNKIVEEMFKNTDINLSDEETNTSYEENTTSLVLDEQSIVQEQNDEQIKEDTTTTEIPLSPTPVEELVKVQETVQNKAVKNIQSKGLYIQPIQKAWVGIIFLDSMRKKDFLIRNQLKLDASKDQIILIGHKNFKIFNKQLEQGFKSKKMVRFLYKDGELREISKQEYLQHAGGVRW